MTDTAGREPTVRELVALIQELIEAGDDIRCYPSGASGFEEWDAARDKAQLTIGRWVDEDGTWRDMA
jgi:hypothetical protein